MELELELPWRRAVDELLGVHRRGRAKVDLFLSELESRPDELFAPENPAGAARSELDTYRWIESVRAGEASVPDSAILVSGLAREERIAAADCSLGLRPGQRSSNRIPFLKAQRRLFEQRLHAEEQSADHHLEQFARHRPHLALEKLARMERVAFGKQVRLAILDLYDAWSGACEACLRVGQGPAARDPRILRLPELLVRLLTLSRESLEGFTGAPFTAPAANVERPPRPAPRLVAIAQWSALPGASPLEQATAVAAMQVVDAQEALWGFLSEFRRLHGGALDFTSDTQVLTDPSSPDALLEHARIALGSTQGHGEPFEALRHVLRACLWLGFDHTPALELLARAAARTGHLREACLATHILELRRKGISREAAPDPRQTAHLEPILAAAAARPKALSAFACFLPLEAAPLPQGFVGDPFRPKALTAWALQVAQKNPRDLTEGALREASRVSVRAALMDGCSTVRSLSVVAIIYGLRYLRSDSADQLELARAAVTLARALHPEGAEEAERFLDEVDPSQAHKRKGLAATIKAAGRYFLATKKASPPQRTPEPQKS